MSTAATALIADDEPNLAAYLRELLKKAWPALDIVAVARNGVEAAERIAALEPDLAFLDIKMPGLTGLEVAQGIEGRPRVVVVDLVGALVAPPLLPAALDLLHVVAIGHGGGSYRRALSGPACDPVVGPARRTANFGDPTGL